jgi:hypothetical protein
MEEIEKQRAENERIRKEAEENIYSALEKIGIPRNIVTLNSYEIRIPRYRLEEVTDNFGQGAESEPDQDATATR